MTSKAYSKRTSLKVLLSAAIAILSSVAGSQHAAYAASTYYVAPNGSDSGEGSQSNPWKTLAFAASRVSGGQGNTIHLNAGTYVETQNVSLKSGVNLEGAGSSQTTLKAGKLGDGGFLIRLYSDFEDGNQTLKDIAIDGQNKALESGIGIRGRNKVTVKNVNFTNISFTGLMITADNGRNNEQFTPPSRYLTGINVSYVNFTNCGRNNGSWSSGALTPSGLDGAVIHDFTIKNSDRGHGIKQQKGGWFKNIKIYKGKIDVPDNDGSGDRAISIELWNVFNDSEIYDLKVNNWFSFGGGNKGSGKRSLKVHNNQIVQKERSESAGGSTYLAIEDAIADGEIYNNYIENPGRYAIAIWERSKPSNNLIHHNVVVGGNINEHRFIYMVPYSGNSIYNTKIYNNTLINLKDVAISLDTSSKEVIDGLDIKNNVFIDSQYIFMGGDGNTLKNATISNNIFYNPSRSFVEVFTNWGGSPPGLTISNNKTDNPGLKYSGNKPYPFYAPASSSSIVVDAGVNVGLPYLGSAPDIGAYEF